MKVLKFSISLIITLTLIILLNNSWQIKGNRLPPLGKFLDPFEGFWQNAEANESTATSKELNIPGLKDKVSIAFDSLMIPHIFANNDEDLYLAQGYVTAMFRLWQMEFQTLAAAGRLSEFIGAGPENRILDYDRGQRRLGMVYGAEHTLQAMQNDPISSMIVQKYTEGINAYIQSLQYKSLPFEYKLLDYSPEPWSPLKCALLLQNMSQTLNMSDKDMEMTNALKLYGKGVIDLLYPDIEGVGDPIVSNPGGWKFKPITIDSIPSALPEELIKIKKLPPSDPNNGSNNWAVAGSKTTTGSPILCGDPHLDLSLPSIWFALQLNAPGVNTMGASLPGAPGVIIGFNDSIAWSETNAQRDVVDWYKISFQDQTKSKYLLDGKYLDTRKVVETYAVRGSKIFYDTVVYTTWGPITYDESFHAKKNLINYAFRWIAHDASDPILAFYKLNRAKNHADYLDALNYFLCPAQNFVFASVSGDIAMRVQGKYPVRRKDEGKFVLDGSKSSNGWKAFIPNEQNVMYKNPARGFVSSANQYPVDSTYPYYVTGKNFEAYRNRRINKILSESSGIKVEDMMKLQSDNFNLKASEALPILLSQLDSTKLPGSQREAYNILKKWNYVNNAESVGAYYFETWWVNLLPLIWDEMENKDVMLTRPTSFVTLKLLKEKPDLAFFDVEKTPEKEKAVDVVRMAFESAVRDIDLWKQKFKEKHPDHTPTWADYKDSYMRHLLRIEPLNVHVRAGGNSGLINAHSVTNGPSWRMVVSLEKSGVKAWGVYPGGQSGNPGSIHYSDMIDEWTQGKHFPLTFLKKPEGNFSLVNLNPASK
jgi:penicillin amidase